MKINAGKEVQKIAKKAENGFSTATKFVMDKIDTAKEKAEANKEYCYELIPSDSEDTENIMKAVSVLKEHQFSACIDIVKGNMHGYVFAKEIELEEIREHLKLSEGCALGIKKADRHTGENVKHLLK